MDTGAQGELHYDQCHPSRWSLGLPRHDNTISMLGLILTGVGVACTVAGFVLLMFSPGQSLPIFGSGGEVTALTYAGQQYPQQHRSTQRLL
ncbi:hypothetical protein QF036_005002 [Arthrobacter globiformis]|nr:hypothetical protein [Arthrobacter globiformis]